jgi:tryptophan synthase alpha chain
MIHPGKNLLSAKVKNMTLKAKIEKAVSEKGQLLMTHLVLGYPSFEVNRKVIGDMVANGVDLIELQIPFSEPVADGPVILKANQASLDNGTTVTECIDFATEIAAEYDIPFLFMTYYNIIYQYGLDDFVKLAKSIGISGLIIPDIPIEEGGEYLETCKAHGVSPVQIFAPTSSSARMKEITSHADGFIYCVARKGVTGSKTVFDKQFDDYLKRCRAATKLPLAVGFGISCREDVDSLKGKAEIAVIGSKTIRLIEEKGQGFVGPFLAGLRS